VVTSKHLGALEQMVLLAVLRLKDGGYGRAILDELKSRGGRRVSPGALYATVDRLEAKGLVRSRLGDPTPGRGGKRKRLLSVTPAGMAALRKARRAWASMYDGLEEIMEA
jgi:PadR family transcriptional regulator PadR